MHCFRVIRYKYCNNDKFEFVEQTYFYRNDGLFFTLHSKDSLDYPDKKVVARFFISFFY